MTLFRNKNSDKMAKKAAIIAILVVFVLDLTNPGAVYAKTGLLNTIFGVDATTTEATLSASPESRMINHNTSLKVPDRVVNAVITAYSSTVDQCDEEPFIAASGKRVYDGMVAANFLPMGTKIKIPALYGDKIFTVDDRMNARYGYGRMDIWLDAPRWKVNEFGVKRLQIEVYLPEKVLVRK